MNNDYLKKKNRNLLWEEFIIYIMINVRNIVKKNYANGNYN